MTAKHGVVGFVAGVVFGLGLLVSGMTQPGRVVGFLDLGGAWDPALAFVMIGAIGTMSLAWWAQSRLATPWMAPAWELPTLQVIDARLVGGASLFGVGWGLSGFCPAPAAVAMGGGGASALVFVPAMLVGMALHGAWAQWSSRARVGGPQTA